MGEESKGAGSETYLAIWGDGADRHLDRLMGCLKLFEYRSVVDSPEGGGIVLSDFGRFNWGYHGDREFEKTIREYARKKGFSEEDLEDSTWMPVAIRARVVNLEEATTLAEDLKEVFDDIETLIYSIPVSAENRS